jgi:hypothetical protein
MGNELGQALPANGAGAAAVLAAAIGGLALGVLALAADAVAAIGRLFNIWNPTGPLSGVTSAAILVWLVAWWVLSRLWLGRNVNLRRINFLAAAMFAAGLLLTFPPFMDLLQGK